MIGTQGSSTPQVPPGAAQAMFRAQPQLSAVAQPVVYAEANGVLHGTGEYRVSLEAEIARRQAAEARNRELEALVSRLRQRIAVLEGKRNTDAKPGVMETEEDGGLDDPIDRTICEYLE